MTFQLKCLSSREYLTQSLSVVIPTSHDRIPLAQIRSLTSDWWIGTWESKGGNARDL